MDGLVIYWDLEFDNFKTHWISVYQIRRDEFLYQLEIELTVYTEETILIYQGRIDEQILIAFADIEY
jgi:hypothetical protein